MRNRWKTLSGLFLFTMLGAVTAAHAQALAPLVNANLKTVIPHQYIVVFRGRAGTERSAAPSQALQQSEAAQRLAVSNGGKVTHVYRAALVGFSASLTPKALEALRAAPGVAYVEADQMGHIDTVEQLPFPAPFPAVFPKGIDRVSERLLPLDGRYTHSLDGTGVNVYVLDTGIRATHTDFGGRVSGGVDEVMDGHGTDDCHGHGTHVSGTIGGTLYGIAKAVQLHPVRIATCTGSVPLSNTVAGVDWVTANAVHPAAANMSIGFGSSIVSLNTAVANAVTSGVTMVVAAGNSNDDACNHSPAAEPSAITVGSVNPDNDTRAVDSNFGTCVDLFGPGVGILSDWNTNDTATNTISGTSMATPHVTGVAALWLQNHTADTPAAVLGAILAAADTSATAGWGGIVSGGAGSPNILLHWGSAQNPATMVFDGQNDGDPHMITMDGAHYNFQGGGEYVALLGDGGTEIQTRETPVQTASSFLGPDPYDQIASCVSLNTAAAMRVGRHRVTFEPNISGLPDPSGMQLRIDGALTSASTLPVMLAGGGRVAHSSVGDGIEVDFPDGTILNVTANWWPGQSLWYLNVDVLHSPATSGLMGTIAHGSWLPLLASGLSAGAMPAAVSDRYAVLYGKFGDSWRVTKANSLFDYKPGTSTATFRVAGWPAQSPPCKVPANPNPPAKPIDPKKAVEICHDIIDKRSNADCSFDVALLGEPAIAKLYMATQRFHAGATITRVSDNLGGDAKARTVIYTARVTPAARGNEGVPKGSVVFSVGGKPVSKAIALDERGLAHWESTSIKVLDRSVTATFTPAGGSVYLPSTGVDAARVGSIQ